MLKGGTLLPPGHVTLPVKISNINSLKKTQGFVSKAHGSEPNLAVSNGLNLIPTIKMLLKYKTYHKEKKFALPETPVLKEPSCSVSVCWLTGSVPVCWMTGSVPCDMLCVTESDMVFKSLTGTKSFRYGTLGCCYVIYKNRTKQRLYKYS